MLSYCLADCWWKKSLNYDLLLCFEVRCWISICTVISVEPLFSICRGAFFTKTYIPKFIPRGTQTEVLPHAGQMPKASATLQWFLKYDKHTATPMCSYRITQFLSRICQGARSTECSFGLAKLKKSNIPTEQIFRFIWYVYFMSSQVTK